MKRKIHIQKSWNFVFLCEKSVYLIWKYWIVVENGYTQPLEACLTQENFNSELCLFQIWPWFWNGLHSSGGIFSPSTQLLQWRYQWSRALILGTPPFQSPETQPRMSLLPPLKCAQIPSKFPIGNIHTWNLLYENIARVADFTIRGTNIFLAFSGTGSEVSRLEISLPQNS